MSRFHLRYMTQLSSTGYFKASPSIIHVAVTLYVRSGSIGAWRVHGLDCMGCQAASGFMHGQIGLIRPGLRDPVDMIRKQRRPEPEDLTWGPENEPDQADALVLAQETEQLGLALAALPEKQRKLIERAYFGELSHSEIAEETGLPLGTIKSRIRLALDRLRHAMT